MVVSNEIKQEILRLEILLHRPEVRHSPALVERLLAPDFIEFGRSGCVYDRQSVVAALTGEDPRSGEPLPQVSEVTCHLLAAECVLLTYRSSRISAEAPTSTLRSSIWKRVGGEWRMVFHQGTPA